VASAQRVRISAELAQRKTAEQMVRSLREIPTFHVTREANAARWIDRATRVGVTATAALLKTVAEWLVEVPEVNSHFTGGEWRFRSTVDVGVALSFAQNVLVVPTLADCAGWSESRFAAALAELRRKAETNQFIVADFAPAGFTVSNLGPWHVDSFTSIIRPPQVAILSVAAVSPRPRVIDGHVVAAKTCTLTMAVDHRVLDGVFAASAMDSLVQRLEELS